MRFPSGTPVRVQMLKWAARPHWGFGGTYLGVDDHGEWLGFPAGSRFTRPGAAYVAPVDQIGLLPAGLLPAAEGDVGRAALATFHAPGGQVSLYVDMATPPVWEGDTCRSVDLDLDVVRGTTGRVWIDDEDEFAEHRVSLGYPDEISALALASCERVHGLVTAGLPPYDRETSRPWFALLSELVAAGVARARVEPE